MTEAATKTTGSQSPTRLSIEGCTAFLFAGLATAACVQNGWFDHICMTLRRAEQYELDEYVGGSVMFLMVTLIMFVRRDWQLRVQLRLAAEREKRAHEVARRDHLTGIPNRLALVERMQGFSSQRVALLLIDLDGFKSINDCHGHAAGDEVLKEISRRIAAITAYRRGGFAARLGGDEFGLLLEIVADTEPQAVVKHLVGELQQPINLASGTVSVGASIGSATSSGVEVDPDELLRGADIAMYRVKNARQSPRRAAADKVFCQR